MKYSVTAAAYWMGCCKALLSAFVICTTTLPAIGYAAAGDAPPSPSASPSPSSSPGLLARMFPLTGTAYWLSVSYYVTSQSYYDIDVQTLDIGRSWRLGSVLELQARLGAFHSNGERLDAPWLTSEGSTTSGVTFGGAARIYAFETQHVRMFIEGAVEMLYTPGGNQFPAGGTGINAFLRAGGGFQCPITDRVALEAHYEYAHVSNGAGSVDQNPMWNGRGGGLTIRRSLR